MRLGFAIVSLTFLVVSFVSAQNFVQPKSNNCGIYANQTRKVNESSVATVGVNDRLKILDSKREYYKVQTADGLTGWIEKRLVASAAGKAFMFDDAEVIGYLDNPTPVYIIDADNKDATPIKLDRSFAEALKQNVDRETVERTKK
jgi:hypothetical protein